MAHERGLKVVVLAIAAVAILTAVGVSWLNRPLDVALPALDRAPGEALDREAVRALLAKVPAHAQGGDPLAGVDPGAAWARVDMEAVRSAMPDNLYWMLAAPTQDPKVIEARAKDRARWNEEYGKVLSNTATAEEVDAYYAHQQLVSSDYLEFVAHVLTHYGDAIPKRDAGLMKLAGEMHLARLEEIPVRSRRHTSVAKHTQRHDAHGAPSNRRSRTTQNRTIRLDL